MEFGMTHATGCVPFSNIWMKYEKEYYLLFSFLDEKSRLINKVKVSKMLLAFVFVQNDFRSSFVS